MCVCVNVRDETKPNFNVFFFIFFVSSLQAAVCMALVLSCLVLSCLVLSCLVLAWLGLAYLTCLVFSSNNRNFACNFNDDNYFLGMLNSASLVLNLACMILWYVYINSSSSIPTKNLKKIAIFTTAHTHSDYLFSQYSK